MYEVLTSKNNVSFRLSSLEVHNSSKCKSAAFVVWYQFLWATVWCYALFQFSGLDFDLRLGVRCYSVVAFVEMNVQCAHNVN